MGLSIGMMKYFIFAAHKKWLKQIRYAKNKRIICGDIRTIRTTWGSTHAQNATRIALSKWKSMGEEKFAKYLIEQNLVEYALTEYYSPQVTVKCAKNTQTTNILLSVLYEIPKIDQTDLV